ncbi:TlpA disulfide reductase family protein [Gelidibacter salicanalis]|uniref:TlpA family protein disulfide reductase n=1 Tax=Gelidibacter salicanalis TaxID=291193 RepID=A0A934KL81_9FLAO|nr:TlpA disulfide reductase family protein [Gelidibacter salicanalis]MBJ7879264.1 TlpA family protein disulfide reductase [Gelidibacter salicanalis]
MKKITFYPFLILLVCFSCKQEEEKKAQPLTMGQLTISSEHPKPGDNLDLTYISDKEVEAFYAYMVGDKNYPLDIEFSQKDGEHEGSIKIPDSAVALAFMIKVDDKFDNNSTKGYLFPLYTKDGEQIQGSNAATSFYAVRYGSNFGIEIDEKTAFEALKTEMTTYPELQSDWNSAYLQMAFKNDKEEGKKLIDAYAASMEKKSDVSEKEYTSMLQAYSMIGEESKVDSIKKVTLQKYPKGSTANFEMIQQFQEEKDLGTKTEIFKNYTDANVKLDNLGNYMAGTLARAYYQQNDMENFENYVSMIDDKTSRASTLNNLAWPMAEKGDNLDQAEKMSKTSLDLITALEKNPKDKPDYYTKKQYEKSLKSSYNMYADTYALILFKQGKVKEAITYQEKAHDPKAQDPEANARYIEYLMADKQYEKVKDKTENFIKSGNGNKKIKEAYKTAYLKVNPTAEDVDDNLAAFEKDAYTTQVTDIKKTMLDVEAPLFTLKDMKGKDVSLASLKGKTVILDFWATWCGPCKASFPGMQEVVTKYKDDDTVALLFVDTFEKGPNREKMVEDFIKTNNYNFHVVYDLAIEDSRDYEVAKKYNISGIPTKIVIGPDGRMKFKSVGYSGSNEKLVNEMDIMIAILKS